MHTKTNNQYGFTIVELLVAIGIISILSVVSIVSINPQKRFASARDADRKASLRQIADALELYKIDHGQYPQPCGRYDSNSCDSYNGDDAWLPGLIEEDIMKNVPKDPVNNGFNSVYGQHLSYFYISETSFGGTAGDYYILGAWLENTDDPMTLDNLGGDSNIRPLWPSCNEDDDILFNGNIYIIRSYNCPNDPEGAL